MTWLDLALGVLLIAYVVLGFYTGVVRRVLGVVFVYAGLGLGTYMGGPFGGILQQPFPTLSDADARLYAFLLVLLVVILLAEGLATGYHDLIQVSVVSFNKATGVLVGAFTGLLLIVAIIFMISGYVSPLGGGNISPTQVTVRSAFNGSGMALPLSKATSPLMLKLLEPVVPPDAHNYFGASPQ